MKNLIQISVLLLFFSLHLNAGNTDSLYTGQKINLAKLPGWELYKGLDKKPVGTNLTSKDISLALRTERDIWWLERDFYVFPDLISKGNIWVSIWSKAGAFEVYINDSLVVKNGRVGNWETEIPGNVFTRSHIPSVILRTALWSGSDRNQSQRYTQDTPVKQRLKIKLSNNYNFSKVKINSINISSREYVQNEIDKGVNLPLFLAGFFMLAMIVNIAFYFALNRKIVFLLLAALFLCNIFIMIRFFVLYGLNPSVIYYIPIYLIYIYSNFVAKLLLIVVLLFEFEIKKKNQLIIFSGSLISITLVYLIPDNQTLYFFISPVIPFLLSLWAVYKKKPGSLLIASALFVLLLFTYLNYERSMTYGLTIGMMVFAVVMIFSVAKKIFNQSKAYQQSLLKSSILENQLLQKHIQPHFLMNSLMSLQELIDVDKERAGEMVELLSKEFHLLATFSKQKLIPLKDELEICRIHLTIMGYQQRASFELKTSGISGEETIPPAVIHTLVENGLTHGYAGKENGYFQLDKSVENNFTRYRLFNDGKTQGSVNKKNTGLGLKYVEARLEESYPGRWKLISHPVENGWEAVIEIGG